MAVSLTVPERTGRVVADDVEVKILGPCRLPSPLQDRLARPAIHYVGKADRVPLDDRVSKIADYHEDLTRLPAFELAGPRDRIFFDPQELRCGIVTCGGLCPGVNNVVRGLVLELTMGYGVEQIYGFRYGYAGLVHGAAEGPVKLTPASVADIHHEGGTALGTSRGNQNAKEMVDTLARLGLRVLFVIGGDGTLRGAMTLVSEIERRGLAIGIVGIPKTIDNDIHFIDRSFGFETAFSAAVDVIRGAHVEARGALNGIGVVKLMGRHSGFIACQAAIASTDVDAVLVPEAPIHLEGGRGLLAYLERRLRQNAHAVIVVAEGAGQELCAEGAGAGPASSSGARKTDPSGNLRLGDIGAVLRDRINSHFREKALEVTLKYIDPSYHIRSVPASPTDSVYCWNMARNAVHCAMAGNTEVLIGRWHGRFVHVPMPLATRYRKGVDLTGDLWMSVIESTGQPVGWTEPETGGDA
ncbi:MAG TPA: ATP-dependent 6-phosphofructokinase [Polyangiaceae bacterium]|nr:ATP-dependent 6-phosphofructokinase [Polyangiaceae bacterium]